ncbi:hypothetical protein [Streptomyces sp. SPB162]|uniref:hypothetical protein n=1 Tax=Streptomyces sp. SPB162 TaxID=2940560 RepID=UPI00240697AF|nr:hypothetical protein [Streptomyces sp. SPB162]MDF9810890.1 F0F1-type ATP synthase membrane subunit c/vacuolar-type H+-ATPase subunit K [Streptomyces sp. SPB162]
MVYLLLLLIVIGAIAVCGFVGYGFGSLGRAGLGRPGRQGWLRSIAALLFAFAVAVYTWGLLCAAGAALGAEDHGAGSSPMLPCRSAGDERAMHVVDYTVQFAPLRFVCETNTGGDYASDDVPLYLNLIVLGSGLAAGACAAAATTSLKRPAEAGSAGQ